MPLLRNHCQDFLYNTPKHETTHPKFPFQEDELKIAMYLRGKMPYMHSDIHNSMNQFEKHYTDQKKPDMRDYLLHNSISMKLSNSHK